MFVQGSDIEREALQIVAKLMCLAARTAPKAGGVDSLVTAVISGDDRKRLVSEMRRLGEERNLKFYAINADMVDASELVVLLGTKLKRYMIPTCGLCGFKDCKENLKAGGQCVFPIGDLGIAIGSAVSVAGRHHADNRLMFSVGRAVLNLNLLGDEVKIVFGIPLSSKGKNPCFDREWRKVWELEVEGLGIGNMGVK
ncbi:MAG: ferredoxin domain-containing protein [Dissulfuribacterales bacterium]